ncbi:MAG: transporter substrate-binding protein [Deltaproteobacteria bacterium]|nr:transporter substrate-binding protein [Deltaproteobacteria bacterium]
MSGTTRVGLLFSSSGATAIPESGLLEASMLAIERCNKDAGCGFAPVVVDICSDPGTAARAAYDLVKAQKAEILIGCYTSACRKAILPVLEETQGTLVYPTIYEGEEAHPRVFYFGAVPNQQVDPLLSWTLSHLSRDFVLVGSDYIYPRSVNRQARRFIEATGGRVLHDLYFPLGCEDFAAFFQGMRSLRGRAPPVVFSTLVGSSIPAFYQQHRASGSRSAIVSPITSEVELERMGPEASAGHYFADGHLENPEVAQADGFAVEYRRRYGDRPINGMMSAVYDAIMLVGRYFRKARAGGASGMRAQRKVGGYLRAPVHESTHGRIVVDPRTQHAWLWSRVARVGSAGAVEPLWTSPGPMPPRPLGQLPWEVEASTVSPGGEDAFGELVGRSEGFTKCLEMARIAARTAAPVLLTGETGTGKELFARAIHRASDRREAPFVAVNCAAIPRDLIGSELFGYAPGAFTGAQREGKKGRFELADRGTLFLDEVTEMPPELQAVLLRALQEKKIAPVGSSRDIDIDVRIVAATNRLLSPELEPSPGFRSDLYFRLNVFRIDVPALRERPEDVPLLAEGVLARLNRQNGRHLSMTRDATAALCRYGWPGNVRELENAIERAFHVAIDGPRIDVAHLPAVVSGAGAAGPRSVPAPAAVPEPCPGAADGPGSWAPDGSAQERAVICRAIESSGHNMSRASRVLGISRSTLYRRMKALEIVVPNPYPPSRAGPGAPSR